jgi:hypothetical protein
VRNMSIPLWRFADGIRCHSKRFGVHELRVKVGSCFREECRKDVRLEAKLTAPSASQPAG